MTHMNCLSNIMLVNVIFLEDELLYKQLSDEKLKQIAENVELNGSKYFTLIYELLFTVKFVGLNFTIFELFLTTLVGRHCSYLICS